MCARCPVERVSFQPICVFDFVNGVYIAPGFLSRQTPTNKVTEDDVYSDVQHQRKVNLESSQEFLNMEENM